MTRLWDKDEPLDQRILHFTVGDDPQLDARLVDYDISASIAHTEMLQQQGYLEASDLAVIRQAFEKIGSDFAAGEWSISVEEEDCHTALESRLIDAIGEAGERIHLGRSRNDQVLVALRLYLKDATTAVSASVQTLKTALNRLVERDGTVDLPGYTHMQPAMPSSVDLWAGAFIEGLDDAQAALTAVERRLDRNPLGSAAGYGTPGLTLDRDATKDALGFAETQTPVTAVQLSRGRAETALVFELTLLLSTLSRLASDLLLFYTQEFGFVSMANEVTTGSSIMPQKRNPDVLELVRASAGTAQGCLAECLALTSKLPSGYQRDLQRLKAPVFRAIDLAGGTLDALSTTIDNLHFNPDAITLDPSLNAAEEAYALVQSDGLTFREAYRQVARKYA